MDQLVLVSLLGAIALSIFKYFENHICYICKKKGQNIISFIVGATIITVFVELLNDIYHNIHANNHLLIVFLPLAFICLMLVERHIHTQKDRKHRQRELKALIQVISFVSGFVIGMVALLDMHYDLVKHTIFILFLLSYDFIREISIRLIEKPRKRSSMQLVAYVFYCMSPIYGFLAARYLPISPGLKTVILASFGGAIMYVIVKEVIVRREEKVQPIPLVIGSLTMIAIFLLNALA